MPASRVRRPRPLPPCRVVRCRRNARRRTMRHAQVADRSVRDRRAPVGRMHRGRADRAPGSAVRPAVRPAGDLGCRGPGRCRRPRRAHRDTPPRRPHPRRRRMRRRRVRHRHGRGARRGSRRARGDAGRADERAAHEPHLDAVARRPGRRDRRVPRRGCGGQRGGGRPTPRRAPPRPWRRSRRAAGTWPPSCPRVACSSSAARRPRASRTRP